MGGAKPLGGSKVGQTVLTRLMESQIWHPLTGSVGGGFTKVIMASTYLDARHFSFPLVPLVPFKLLPQCWNSEGVTLSR